MVKDRVSLWTSGCALCLLYHQTAAKHAFRMNRRISDWFPRRCRQSPVQSGYCDVQERISGRQQQVSNVQAVTWWWVFASSSGALTGVQASDVMFFHRGLYCSRIFCQLIPVTMPLLPWFLYFNSSVLVTVPLHCFFLTIKLTLCHFYNRNGLWLGASVYLPTSLPSFFCPQVQFTQQIYLLNLVDTCY